MAQIERNSAESPVSERWSEYYKLARVRRRAHGPRDLLSREAKRRRQKERFNLLGAIVILGAIFGLSYALLTG